MILLNNEKRKSEHSINKPGDAVSQELIFDIREEEEKGSNRQMTQVLHDNRNLLQPPPQTGANGPGMR